MGNYISDKQVAGGSVVPLYIVTYVIANGNEAHLDSNSWMFVKENISYHVISRELEEE